MKNLVLILITLVTSVSWAQQSEELLIASKKANNLVYEGNNLINDDQFISAEMAYRKAISKNPTTIAGTYNLGNSYYKEGNFEEALYRHQQAAEKATTKIEKHKAFHNIGNVLMQKKQCKEATEAFKNALRNNPNDDETRYNYALAKACAEQQKEDQEDKNNDDEKKDEDKENKDNKDQKDNKDKDNNDDNKDKEGDKDKENQDEENQEEKENKDKKEDEGKPKNEKEDKKEDNKKPKPQPGQLSPQQIKNLLEAMNNQEQKVQEKMNAEKQKGVKIKTEKDW